MKFLNAETGNDKKNRIKTTARYYLVFTPAVKTCLETGYLTGLYNPPGFYLFSAIEDFLR